MTKADLMDNFDQVVTNPALTLEVVNAHVDNLREDDYLLDQYRVIATSGTTGARGCLSTAGRTGPHLCSSPPVGGAGT